MIGHCEFALRDPAVCDAEPLSAWKGGEPVGYLRMRRSVRLGPGVRVNMSKRSVGLSVGTRGTRYSVNSSGRRTTSVGVPGTGVGYVSSSGGGRSPRRQEVQLDPPRRAKKPGMFASKTEKRFANGVELLASGRMDDALAAFREASEADSQNRSSADDLMTAMVLVAREDWPGAITYLERVTGSQNPLPDKLMDDYAPGLGFTASINGSIQVSIPVGSFLAAITLATAYRAVDRVDEAIGVLQQLHDLDPSDPFVIASLCILYAQTDEPDEIVELTTGVRNDDDLTCLICAARAEAMADQGMLDAAYEVAKEATKSKRRDSEALNMARYIRAEILAKQGKPGMARKEFEKIYADDPEYRDIRSRIDELG